MKKIGGNTTALIQIKVSGSKNSIGEAEENWVDVASLEGWLDYLSGENDNSHRAKVQDSTHIYMCDFCKVRLLSEDWLWDPFSFISGVVRNRIGTQAETIEMTSELARFILNGNIYNILLIDDPMGMHYHMEIYLRYVGGGLGVS